MTKKISFAVLKAAGFQHLAAIVPELKAHRANPAAQALAIVVAVTSCRLTIEQRPNDVAVRLIADPAPRRDKQAADLLATISAAIEAPLRSLRQEPRCDIGQWLDEAGLTGLVADLLAKGATRSAVGELADTVSPVIKSIYGRSNDLEDAHFAAVIQRDLPSYPTLRAGLTPPAFWALASDLSGNALRPTILKRRLQALEIYGSIASILVERPITAVIDCAEELVPALCQRLGIEPAYLRRLCRARTLAQTFKDYSDYAGALRELAAHSVPLHEWPERADWAASPWIRAYSGDLFRIDYMDRPEPRDAISALKADILGPLAAARADAAGLPGTFGLASFLNGHGAPQSLPDGERRVFLTGLRSAIIGRRGIKSFHEAVSRWHRRAASLASMRHERSVDRPGWPALCPVWNAPDGIHRLVPLTSAAELVEEGNALQHCVGGYYGHCRSGDTQILSLRSGDDHAATLELLLSGEPGEALTIRAGQFRSYGDQRASEHLYDIVRAFLDDIKTGAHPVARTEIGAYRKKMRKEGDHAWQSGPLPIEHARAAWPLYRALLPRGVPEDFDTWCETSSLNAAYDRLLKVITTAKPAA